MIVSEILSRIRDWIKTGVPLNVKSSNVRTLLTWITLRMDVQETGRLKIVKIAGNTSTEQEIGDRVSGIIENTAVVNGIYLGGNESLLSSYYIPNSPDSNPTENIYGDISEMLAEQTSQTSGYSQRVLDDYPYTTGEAVYLYKGVANGLITDYIKLSEAETALLDFTPTGGYTGTAQDLKNDINNIQTPGIDQVLEAGDLATRNASFWDPDTQNAVVIRTDGSILFSLGGANHQLRQEEGSSQDTTFVLPNKIEPNKIYVLATTEDIPTPEKLISSDPDNVLVQGSDDKLFVPQGAQGVDGKSAYGVAVENGFVGTEAQWLASLEGPEGLPGTDATVTETAVRNAGAVMTTGAQTIQGVKTFESSPIVPTPEQDFEVATKGYADQAREKKTTQTISSGGNYNNLEITGDVVIFENENAQAIINGIRGKKDFLIINNSTQHEVRINNEASVTGTAKNISLPTTTPALIGVGGTARIVENEINYTLVDVFASKYRPEFRELVGVNVQTVDENSVGGTMPTKQIETYRDTQSTAMSKADLNTAYPDAKRPFNVVCRQINRIYKKVDDINNDWISITTTTVV